jgi:arylsulfatase A-like enzyme
VSTDYAVKFLEQQSADRPFFLFLGFKSPHGPRGGDSLPERVRELYADDESRSVPNVGVKPIFDESEGAIRPNAGTRPDVVAQGQRAYMRHTTAIDDCIGRVLDALEKTGQAKNPYVIVTSDNGYYLGEHGLSDKRSAYEESIRVPLIIHVPGDANARGLRDAMVLNIDHAPTILELAGAEPLPNVHGRSMRPLYGDENATPWRDAFFYEYFKEGRFASPTVLAARTASHKLIKYPGHDEWTELFDLKNDPYETKNLADDAELMAQMQTVFDEQLKAVAFRMPEALGRTKPRAGRRARERATRATPSGTE